MAGLALLLVAAGFGFYKLDDLSRGIASSPALDGAATSTDGGVTILLMGLDSRKDQNGQQLPQQILDQLHAGDGNEGGYNTNTLILMHVPGDGTPVRALSIQIVHCGAQPQSTTPQFDDVEVVSVTTAAR